MKWMHFIVWKYWLIQTWLTMLSNYNGLFHSLIWIELKRSVWVKGSTPQTRLTYCICDICGLSYSIFELITFKWIITCVCQEFFLSILLILLNSWLLFFCCFPCMENKAFSSRNPLQISKWALPVIVLEDAIMLCRDSDINSSIIEILIKEVVTSWYNKLIKGLLKVELCDFHDTSVWICICSLTYLRLAGHIIVTSIQCHCNRSRYNYFWGTTWTNEATVTISTIDWRRWSKWEIEFYL